MANRDTKSPEESAAGFADLQTGNQCDDRPLSGRDGNPGLVSEVQAV